MQSHVRIQDHFSTTLAIAEQKIYFTKTELIHYILVAIWQTPRFGSIRKSGFESRISFGWGNQSSELHLALAEVCSLRVLSS